MPLTHHHNPRDPQPDGPEQAPGPARPPVDPDQLPYPLDLPADPDPAPVIPDPHPGP
jgi:hypothetical protein